MSYFLWMLLSRGSRKYPTGIAWLLLSALRIVDYIAIAGIALWLGVQVAGFAVDARSWVHYKALENSYATNLDMMSVSQSQDGEDAVEFDRAYENFRRVEKQRAMFGTYGKIIVAEETVYDKWRGLFNSEKPMLKGWDLTPFFWIGGRNDFQNSVYEIDLHYTLLGKDGRTPNNSSSWGKGYINLGNSYMLVNNNIQNNIKNNQSIPENLKDKYSACAADGSRVFVPNLLAYEGVQPISLATVDSIANDFNKQVANYRDSVKCLVDTQVEMGVKPYPPQNFLDYNEAVISYKEAVLKDATQRLEAKTKVNDNKDLEVFMLESWDAEWLERMNLLHNNNDCSDVATDCETETNHFINDRPNDGMLITSAFYDVVIKGNDAYQDKR